MRRIPELTQMTAELLVGVLRRLDPLYRDGFDRLLQKPIEQAAQALIRLQLKDEGLGIAQEQIRQDEERITARITEAMNRFLIKEYRDTGRTAERAGNTKTYGLVKATLRVRDDLPQVMKVGLFREARAFPAYVRFGGPGPRVTADIDDNGILSMGVKVMGVPGRKLFDDERYTQDFSGISSPTFTTPNIYENLKLQREVGLGTPAWYFLNPFDSHYLDMIMQGIYARTHANPLELTYFSCVPYLFGEGRAIKYAFRPRIARKSRVGRISYNYLQDAMAATLRQQPMLFDLAVQFQTDPVSQPIENASVVWSEKQSPFINIATLEIPVQTFDSPEQMAFARNISINPWHSLPEHRPLGNQNRARKAIYQATSQMRRRINRERHIEPTGAEVFTGTGIDTGTGRTQPQGRHSNRTTQPPGVIRSKPRGSDTGKKPKRKPAKRTDRVTPVSF